MISISYIIENNTIVSTEISDNRGNVVELFGKIDDDTIILVYRKFPDITSLLFLEAINALLD